MKGLLFILFSAGLVVVGSTSYAVEEEDILLYYSFDKLSGKTVKDDSGNGHDGELIGKGGLVKGQFGQAIQLNGGIVQMDNRDVISSVGKTGEITLESWIFLNDHAAYDGIISIEAHDGGGCCEFRTMVNPGFLPFWDAGHHADKSLANFTFELKEWYHYVLVADGKDGKIYINGEFIGEQAENFDLPEFKDVSIYIGAGENPGVHKVEDAIIDEVVIYNKALSEEEINESMKLSVPVVLSVQPQDKLAVKWAEIKSSR